MFQYNFQLQATTANYFISLQTGHLFLENICNVFNKSLVNTVLHLPFNNDIPLFTFKYSVFTHSNLTEFLKTHVFYINNDTEFFILISYIIVINTTVNNFNLY